MISIVRFILLLLLLITTTEGNTAQLGSLFEQRNNVNSCLVPEVTLTGDATSIVNTQTLHLNANATYCNGCTPFYFWEATGGSFSGSENSPNVIWIPPKTNSDQTYNIFVTVGDGQGKIATNYYSVNVTVTGGVSACTTALGTPQLYNGGLWVENNYLVLDWQQISNATSYVLQESTSSSFSGTNEYTASGYASTSRTLNNKANGTYYYRVKAYNSCGDSGWSNVSTRVVKANALPKTPATPLPANGSTSVSRTPTLSWSGGDADGLAEYAVELGTAPNNMWFAQGYGDSNSYSTSKLINLSLKPSTTYYWRVRSKDDHGSTVIGPIWNFTTANSSADLVPISATVAGSIANGKTVTMNVVIQNQGNYASDGATLRFYYSPSENGQDYEYIGRVKGLPILQPGASAAVSMDLPIRDLLPGTSYLVAKVDTYLMTTERDVSNNTISYAINYTDIQSPVFSYFDFRYPVNGAIKTNSKASFVYTILDDIGASSIDLFYSSNNGVSWSPIVSKYPVVSNGGYGVNTYDWTIPASTPLNSAFKVKIAARDSSGNMSSSQLGPYTVIDGSMPNVSISSPAQGNVWDLNSTHSINWSAVSPNGIHKVLLTYYYNNGRSATPIASLSGNPGNYSWTIPASSLYASTTGQIVLDIIDNNFNKVTVKSGYFTVRDSSIPPPAPWTSPSQITSVPSVSTSYTDQHDNSPTIAVDSTGNAHMAYVYTEDNKSSYYTNSNNYPGHIIKYTLFYSKRTGTAWSTPVAVRTIVNNQEMQAEMVGARSISNPRIAVSPSGKPSLVWNENIGLNRSNLSEVFFSYLNGNSWVQAVNVSNNSNIGSFTWNNLSQPPENSSGVPVKFAASGTDIYAMLSAWRLSKYSTTGNTWTASADIPAEWFTKAANELDICVDNGQVYAADSSGNFISYTPSTNTWSQKAQLLTSGPGLRIRAIGGKIYAVGTGPTSDLQEYNPTTNLWTKRAAMPTARNFSAVSVLNNKLQVIGGAASSGTALRTFEEYNPSTNTWLVKPNTNALSGIMGGADILNGKIYLTAQNYAAIEVYDPNINLWMPVDRMATRMGKGDIVTANGKILKISDGVFSQGVLSGQSDVIPKISSNPRIAIDSNNTVHVFWLDGCHEYGVDGQSWANTTTDCTYFYRNFNISNGVWSSVSTPVGMSLTSSNYDFAISPDDTLHLIFRHNDSISGKDTINYIRKDSSGWRVPMIAVSDYVGTISELSLSVGTNGSPRLIGRNFNYLPSKERLFFSQLSNGIWSYPETVVSGSNGAFEQSRLVQEAAGSPVVVYRQLNNGFNVYITKRLNNGTWSIGLAANTAAQSVGVFDAAVGAGLNTLHLPYTVNVSGHDEVFFNVADLGPDFVSPSISVSGPSESATISGGTVQRLIWNGGDDKGISSVTLKYTTDGGNTYTTIATSLPASGAYSWNVPNIAANTVHIVAVASDAAGNQSVSLSATFKIVLTKLTALTISGPGSVNEGSTATYLVKAYYDNGTSATVTGAISLATTPFATLTGGTLTGKAVSTNQTVTLNANFAGGGVTKSASMPVTIRNILANASTLTVTITPLEALAAGVKWSIDGGITWRDSGVQISLASGNYKVVFKTMNGWELPSINNVVVKAGQSVSMIGNPDLAGDINGDSIVDLADAIIALRVLNGLNITSIGHWYDVNGDEVIGLEEAIFILHHAGISGQQ